MNRDACEKLYNAYFMRVFSYTMTLTGDRHTAEEITQETFFRAFTKRQAFRGESDELTWLCAIAKNLVPTRSAGRADSGPFPEDGPPPAGVEQGRGPGRFLPHPPGAPRHGGAYREVFELRVFGELSFQQIGQIFAKTENWARVTYHRARLKLKERMENHEQGM